MNGHDVAPSRVSVRMHNVGFGDCFLLSFVYPEPLEDNRMERHVLIDFGSTSLPPGRKDLRGIGSQIDERTGGQLDAVVVTHRHRDHLSAFAVQDVVDQLEANQPPKLIVRSWTEDPTADANFTGGNGAPGAESLRFVQSLGSARGFADATASLIAAEHRRGIAGELHQLALTQLANAEAVAQLETWADGGRGEYVHYGSPTRLESLLPGVRVSVLGPPTIEQHSEVSTQRESDPQEFWMLYKGLVGSVPKVMVEAARSMEGGPPETSGQRSGDLPSSEELGPVRWLTDRLDRHQIGSFLRIVRLLDDVLNNTSLILLFEVAGQGGMKRMLFPGDAQIENWEYALKIADVTRNTDLLRDVDLYKVGHHGSRNATPRTLFGLWTDVQTQNRPMTAMMSTKSGVHGESAETFVPRGTLVTALAQRMSAGLFDSEKLDGLWVEVSTDTHTAGPFVESARG